MILLPPNIVEKNNANAQAYIWVEWCPFCKLGFEPLWEDKKHLTNMCIVFGVHTLIFHCLLSVLIFCVGKICMKDRGLLLVSRSPRVSFHFHNSNKLPKSQISKVCIYFLFVTFVPTFLLFFNCMKFRFQGFCP
jgi:hypothetical protein